MTQLFQLLLIASPVIALIIILYVIFKKPKKKLIQTTSIFDKYSDHGKIWVKKMWDMHEAGLTWDKDNKSDLLSYEQTLGINLATDEDGSKIKAFYNDIGISNDWVNADQKSLESKLGDFSSTLSGNLGNRWIKQYKPLRGENEAEVMKNYALNIDSNEILYYNSIKIDWYEEQTISTNIHYGGFKYKLGGKMSFNTGTFNVVKNNIKGFVIVDRGSLYITNKRIIFIGAERRQNRTIALNDLLELSIYKDGILLGKANGKKPLILVPGWSDGLVPRDNLNIIIRVLDRVMSGNQNEERL